jgi:hypothetical protein
MATISRVRIPQSLYISLTQLEMEDGDQIDAFIEQHGGY